MSAHRWEEEEKSYDPLDATLTLVNRSNDLDPLSSDDEDSSLKAEMSCGHAVTPESLTQYCRSQLDQGNYQFRCPALLEDDSLCNEEWSYREVRRLADLNVEEMQYFEETIARLAASKYSEVQSCPQCKTSVERKDLSNLCVQCVICRADQRKSHQFCWQCLRPWKGPGPRSDRCGNDGCTNQDLRLLRTCKDIVLPQVQGVNACPSIRACPTCGLKVEHDKTGCKNIICPRCQVEFCFVCLKLTPECLKTSTHFMPCSDGVAPRQTSIPVWHRN
ncbi:uncharacterized protein LOC125012182 [Mugil cephalus]|uniref:uncharacterized protein LOC125012182 n=1 Tax=Mugil cephalus TaxID=48193 RepID=UPI001FB79D76|nr:uncharacterized protein LOC125012182 [Mugil cephalus]XP_047447938.1 uncharacterized protein LOC125012182 [Mugil cephalus]XP_047447946.1 uncharacterized protein LOC125012182 [Mugil cephalus]